MPLDEIFFRYIWVLQVSLTVLFTLLLAVLLNKAIRHFLAKAELSPNILDDVLLDSMTGPTRWLVWLIGLYFAAYIIGKHTESPISDLLETARNLGIIVLVTWFSLRFSKKYAGRYVGHKKSQNKSVDVTLISLFGKLFRAAVIVISGLAILQTMGISIAGLLAFGGVGGLAVGMAARDMLANFFGGLTVYLDQPFKVGDWIRSPEKEIEGTVEDIGWRRTVIRTFDKRPLYVPNAIFTNITVENPSRMSHRRIYETIGVRYDDIGKVEKIIEEVRILLEASKDIDQKQTLMVNLNKFNHSSVDFFIYAHTTTTVWTKFHTIKEGILLEIADIINRNDADIAFPTTTIHISNLEKLKQTS